jgi:hypothetical protein
MSLTHAPFAARAVLDRAEAEGTGPAACDICGDALEASGSMKCRSRRLHYDVMTTSASRRPA